MPSRPAVSELPRPHTPMNALTDDMLERFAERAPQYDSENRFFTEDFEELRASGYLLLAVPTELGGRGLSLAEVVRQQRRLAYYAAPTALAVNMHLYWTGVAADLLRAGDTSLTWLLKEAAQGEVFAAGHAESGNDIPVLLSTTKAERVEGGYRFTGRKSFGSLSPVWTYLGMHGMDMSDPAAPRVVHGFMQRDTEGYRIEETWDVLGMRATRSDDTILDGAFVPDRYIARVVPPGAAGVDHFVLAVFAWALLGFGNIYYGLARRALDLTLQSAKTKRSIALTRPMAYHAEVQHRVAEMGLALDSIEPLLERIATDWSTGVDHGAQWPAKIVSAKYHAVENCLARRRSGARGGRRIRHLPQERPRADLSRRASRPYPSGELDVHARARREDAAGHQPRRNAAVGVRPPLRCPS